MFTIRRKEPALLSDEVLMEQVSKGTRSAFETLYDRYFDKLVWFARGFLNDEQQAEDLVQDVFIIIIEAPGKFDSRRRFSTWVYTVVSNRCRQQLRNQKNRQRILDEKVGPSEPQSAHHAANPDGSFLKERIRVLFETLSDKEQTIYRLRFEQELSIREIALAIGIPEGSVKSGIFYLLKKFANHLKEFDHEH